MSFFQDPAEDDLRLFGCNIYADSGAEQNAILVDGVMPWLATHFEQENIRRFFFDRFDARGPHMTVIIGCRAPRLEALKAELAEILVQSLSKMQISALLSEEARRLRHQQCNGKSQCPVDLEEGFAEAGSFRTFDQPLNGFPFWLGPRAADSESFFLAWSRISRFAAKRLELTRSQDSDLVGAIALVARTTRALSEEGCDPALLWRYHLGTLLPSVRKRLETDSDTEILASPIYKLPDQSRQILESFWVSGELRETGILPDFRQLVRSVVKNEWGDHASLSLLREIHHTAVKQLGLMVSQEIPLILFAWQRTASSLD